MDLDGRFSLLALAISAVGIYSVVFYTVAEKTNEFNIRIAVGAARSHVWRTVVASLSIRVGSGIVIGTVLALALNRMAASWSASYISSPAMLLPGIFILAVVSGIACALPAWCASNIDPIMALRSE